MRHLALLLIALALATPARAQTDPLTLQRALALAREHSAVPRIASGRLQVVAGTARERAAPANPTVELRQESVGGSLPREEYATLTLPLDLTFRRAALRTAAREQTAAAGADSAATVRELDAAVGVAFWRLSLADALAGSAAAQCAAMEEIAAFEETRLREGAVAEGAVLRVRLEADRARLALARSRAEAARAHALLAEIVGVPPERLPHPAPPAQSPASALPALEGAVQSALLARPEVLAAERRVAAARRGVTAEWRALLPDVGLQLGARRTAGSTSGVVALAVPLPLRNRNEAGRERARGELLLAEAELQRARERVRGEVAASLTAVVRLREARGAGSDALAERGDEIARIAGAAYREGAITLTELLDAERARADARASAVAWAAELATARIELNRALGAPIDEGL